MVMAEGIVSFFFLLSLLWCIVVVQYRKEMNMIMMISWVLFYIATLFALLYTKQTGDLFVLLQPILYITIFMSYR